MALGTQPWTSPWWGNQGDHWTTTVSQKLYALRTTIHCLRQLGNCATNSDRKSMNEVFAAKNKEVTIVGEFLLQKFWRIRPCQKTCASENLSNSSWRPICFRNLIWQFFLLCRSESEPIPSRHAKIKPPHPRLAKKISSQWETSSQKTPFGQNFSQLCRKKSCQPGFFSSSFVWGERRTFRRNDTLSNSTLSRRILASLLRPLINTFNQGPWIESGGKVRLR